MTDRAFRLRILGVPRVTAADGGPVDLPAGKPLGLLVHALLAAEPPSRDQLAALLWPDVARSRARASVRQAIWVLRRELGQDLLTSDEPVAVRPGLVDVDLLELRAALARGDLYAAIELWDGPPLEGLGISGSTEWSHWVEHVRIDAEQRFAAGLADRGNRAREDGFGDDAVDWLRRARDVQPYHLSHHVDFTEALLEKRDFDEAGEALLAARRALDDADSLERIRELERRLHRLRRGPSGGEADEGALRLPFTGRAEELASLLRCWRRARAGHPSVGVVSGEPGVGKTRLTDEVAFMVAAEGARAVRVKAEDSERPIEWALLAELVQRLLRLSGAAGISHASDGVLRALIPSLGAADPLEAGDGAGVPSMFPRTRPSAAVSDALADLLAAVAEDAPLLVVVDDLQWADTESRAVLGRVATRLDEMPVLFLFACRADVEDARLRKTLSLLGEAPDTLALELRPWSREEVAEALRAGLRFTGTGGAEAVIDRISRTSRGNPLFVIELLEVLVEEGVLTRDDDEREWVCHTDRLPIDLPFPQNLRALLDRQIGQLSDHAALVATHLARSGQPASPRELAMKASLSTSAVTDGIAELLQRRMVRWEDGRSLTFMHDELRAAVAGRFQLHIGLTAGGGAHWSFFRTAFVATMALLFLGAIAYAFGRPVAEGARPFGGGTIFVLSDDRIDAFRLVGPAPEGFDLRPGGGRAAAGAAMPEPVRLSTGELVWLEGEQSPLGVSAGSRASFSPDGTRLLVLTRGRRDLVEVLTPGGATQARWMGPPILDARWCGPREVLLLVREAGDPEVRIWSAADGSESRVTLTGVTVGGGAACSPDGAGVLVQGASAGRIGLFLHDRDAGTTTPLPWQGPGVPESVRWVPDEAASPPSRLVLAGDPLRELEKGDRAPLRASLELPDGETPADSVRWLSRDPRVAPLTSDGAVVARREGEAWIIGEWGGWLRDSVRVRVRATGRSERIFADDFSDPALGAWKTVGSARIVEPDDGGERAVVLEGENGGPAALTSHRSIPLDRGGVAEAEVLLPAVPGGGAPWVELCLAAPGHDDGRSSPGREDSTPTACLRLPAVPDAPSDPGRLALRAHPAFPERVFDVGGRRAEAEDAWIHLAISVAPDGEVTAYVDHVRVGSAPVAAPLVDGGEWRLLIRGQGGEAGVRVRSPVLRAG